MFSRRALSALLNIYTFLDFRMGNAMSSETKVHIIDRPRRKQMGNRNVIKGQTDRQTHRDTGAERQTDQETERQTVSKTKE